MSLSIKTVKEAATRAKWASEDIASSTKDVQKAIEDAVWVAQACANRVELLHRDIHDAVVSGQSSELLYYIAAMAGHAPESGIECAECLAFVKNFKKTGTEG